MFENRTLSLRGRVVEDGDSVGLLLRKISFQN